MHGHHFASRSRSAHKKHKVLLYLQLLLDGDDVPRGRNMQSHGSLGFQRKTAPVMAQLTWNVDIFKFSKDFRSGRNPKGLNLYVPRRKSNDLSSARPGEFRRVMPCPCLVSSAAEASWSTCPTKVSGANHGTLLEAVLLSCCPASQVLTCEASGELDTFLTQHRPSARESEQICVWRGGSNPSIPIFLKMK